jgi:hypothetical protein
MRRLEGFFTRSLDDLAERDPARLAMERRLYSGDANPEEYRRWWPRDVIKVRTEIWFFAVDHRMHRCMWGWPDISSKASSFEMLMPSGPASEIVSYLADEDCPPWHAERLRHHTSSDEPKNKIQSRMHVAALYGYEGLGQRRQMKRFLRRWADAPDVDRHRLTGYGDFQLYLRAERDRVPFVPKDPEAWDMRAHHSLKGQYEFLPSEIDRNGQGLSQRNREDSAH